MQDVVVGLARVKGLGRYDAHEINAHALTIVAADANDVFRPGWRDERIGDVGAARRLVHLAEAGFFRIE